MLHIEEFSLKAKAPIEHLFNCHTWCDAEWCWAKELDDATHKIMTNVMQNNVCKYYIIPFQTIYFDSRVSCLPPIQQPVVDLSTINDDDTDADPISDSEDESESDVENPTTNTTSDDSDSVDAYVPSSSGDEDEDEWDDIDDYGLYDAIVLDEISDNQAISKCESTYDDERRICVCHVLVQFQLSPW